MLKEADIVCTKLGIIKSEQDNKNKKTNPRILMKLLNPSLCNTCCDNKLKRTKNKLIENNQNKKAFLFNTISFLKKFAFVATVKKTNAQAPYYYYYYY